MTSSPIILASASPRRLELLQQINIKPLVHPAHIDETPFEQEDAPDYVVRMAREKAGAVASAFQPGTVIIGADTSVVADNRILGKPQDYAEFVSMMQLLSSRSHTVLSAVCITADNAYHGRLNQSQVWFRSIDNHEIDAYWRSGEPRDKAGGYGIQGIAALFIEKIEGSYSGIMGLPLHETGLLLNRLGIKTLGES